MTARVKVVNPRYAGATPEDVARALLRPLAAPSSRGRKPVRGNKVAVEQPAADQSRRDNRHLREGA